MIVWIENILPILLNEWFFGFVVMLAFATLSQSVYTLVGRFLPVGVQFAVRRFTHRVQVRFGILDENRVTYYEDDFGLGGVGLILGFCMIGGLVIVGFRHLWS